MKRALPFFLLLALPAAAATVDEVKNPRSAGVWVSDMAEVIDFSDETEINATLEVLNQNNGAEVALVTVPRVDEYDPKRFATELFNRWGVGVKGSDNGVLVLFSLGDRRIEIETGYGAEGVLTDGEAGAILDRYAVPAFKRQDYGTGLRETMEAIAVEMKQGEPAFQKYARKAGVSVTAVLIGGGVLALIALILLWRWWRKRPPKCSRCGEPMQLLSEAQEKAYLNADRAFEESIGSVDHLVFRCHDDREMTIRGLNKWGSGFHNCNRCGRRTASSSSITLRSATYSSGGLVEHTNRCSLPRCGHVETYTRSTPRLQRSTTSSSSSSSSSWSSSSSSWSSSSSSSFGGGSSGGGGAGRSW
jgi:uncharacterized protein